MQHFLVENNLSNSSDCIIIGVFDNQTYHPKCLTESEELLTIYYKRLNSKENHNDYIWHADIKQNFILFKLGNESACTADSLNNSLKKILHLIKENNFNSITLSLPPCNNISSDVQLRTSYLCLESNFYQFQRYKTADKTHTLQKIYYDIAANSHLITETAAVWSGMHLCLDLANTPANDCTPIDLEQAAQQLATEMGLSFKALNEEQMRAIGMNTLLAVGQGSANPPRLIELHFNNGGNDKPLIIIGKGITFDSGGICLKPADPMFEMKYDMCGAASVLGVMKTIALLKLPVNVIGIIACAENMPGSKATRPGDVVTSHLGKTVEIINTDAEGRLVLADAISYAQQYNPEAIVDIATLTGAIIIALGKVYTGMMSNNHQLAQSILNAGTLANDKVWQLPLDNEYKDALTSPVADLANATLTREAGSITAAHFLQEFAKDTPWAHLDIAGTAWISGKNRHATARPVGLLVEWIRHYNYEKN